MGNLIIARCMLGEYEKARACYEQAQSIYAEIGHRYGYATNLAYLGLAYRGLKKVDQDRQYLTEAITLFEEIGVPNIIKTMRQWLDDLDAR